MVASSVQAHPGATPVAVLALPPAEHAVDFETQPARVEFDGLLAAVREVYVTGSDDGGSRQSTSERARLAVVEAVDVLIAVWHRSAARGRGYRRDRGRPPATTAAWWSWCRSPGPGLRREGHMLGPPALWIAVGAWLYISTTATASAVRVRRHSGAGCPAVERCHRVAAMSR
jgi:hypothetical protein